MIEALTLPLWAYGGYSDYRTRRAPNLLWGILLLIAIPITSYRIAIASVTTLELAFSVTFLTVVSLLLYKIQFIAGADVKALLVLGFAFPILGIEMFCYTIILASLYALVDWDSETMPFLIPLCIGISLSLLSGTLLPYVF